MTHLRAICRALKTLLLAVACWAALYGTALAKKPEAVEEPKGSGMGWTVSYALVLLGVALGLIAVLRPGKRRERARSEEGPKEIQLRVQI
jgi:hypothetical protein